VVVWKNLERAPRRGVPKLYQIKNYTMNYRQQHKSKSRPTLKANTSYVGETLEAKIFRMMNNKEPIGDAVPLTYTAREEGVGAEYDIRTDRWEVAVDGMDKASKAWQAQREERMGERTYDTMTPEQQTKFNEKFPKNKHAKAAAQQNNQGT